MMDKTFCDKKMPTPFRSSISLYTYQPKDEDLPEEYIKCGQTITYLKVSCSITGYQHSEEIKGQIVDLLASVDEIDYSKIEQIIEEYYGCYGVMLNVSVHPSEKNKDDLKKYPHIIDFVPKLRDFYQAESETGEVLTSSTGKLSAAISYGSVDSTQNSRNAGSTLRVPEKSVNVAGVGGIKEGSAAEVRADTGQVRKETDQAIWGVTTDAPREPGEGQFTTIQLSQMYNLLTGYHSGTNRTSFVMLPRPHVMQPTDRRTFIQGLRMIEGIQDFFLIVLRDKPDSTLRVDVNLQTGHFPENLNIKRNSEDEEFEFTSYRIKTDLIILKAKDIGAGFKEGKKESFSFVSNNVIPEGWQSDVNSGEPGRGGVKEISPGKITIPVIDFETNRKTSEFEIDAPKDGGENVSYNVHNNQLVVTFDLEAKGGFFPFGGNKNASFQRVYEIYLKRKKLNSSSPTADNNDLLITQRKLCTQITFNECIAAIDLTTPRDIMDLIDVADLFEPPFDLSGLIPPNIGIGLEPGINPDIAGSRVGHNPLPTNFSFQKAILRKINIALINVANSPSYQPTNKISFLQTRSFQKQLLQILPKQVLESPANSNVILNKDLSSKFSKEITLKKLLTMHELQLKKQIGISKNDILNFKKSK
jgi:hypothetical protein